MKTIIHSTAIVIINTNPNSELFHNVILGQVSNNIYYTIPKGCSNPNETRLDTIIRETLEEFNIDLSDKAQLINWFGIENLDKIIQFSEIYYNTIREGRKFLTLFLIETNKFPNINELRCNSFYNYNGYQIPEIGHNCKQPYKYSHFNTLTELLNPALNRLIQKCISMQNNSIIINEKRLFIPNR